MSVVSSRNVHWTEEEYLSFEENSETKHEYQGGEIYAMAGARAEHNKIASNALGALSALVRRGRRCQVFNSDQRIHVPRTGLYTYADGGVGCGRWQIHEKDGMSLLNPTLLFEVLSPSTRDYDRGAKLAHYRQIPSLVDVLIIDHPEHHIEHHRQENGLWVTSSHQQGSIELPALGGAILFEDIYYLADEG